jgi:hypothetical protein
MGRLCFLTYAADMKEYDVSESNSTTVKVALTKKYTKDNIGSFLGFLHGNMIDSPTSIVLLGSNKNKIGSTGRGRCRCSCLRRVGTWIGAMVGIVTSFSTSIALLFS